GGRGHAIADAVERPHPALEAVDEPGRLQLGEVVTDRRLAEVERGGEVAHADRLGFRFEQGGHLPPPRGRQCFVDRRQLLHRFIVQGRCERDAAAADPFGRFSEWKRLDHYRIVPEALTLVDASSYSTRHRPSSIKEVAMSRVQLALNVSDLDA